MPANPWELRADVRPRYDLNPLSELLEGFRWSVLGTSPPSAGAAVWAVSAAVATAVLGLYVFRKLEASFADLI